MKTVFKVLGVLTWVGGALLGLDAASLREIYAYSPYSTAGRLYTVFTAAIFVSAFITGALLFAIGEHLGNQQAIIKRLDKLTGEQTEQPKPQDQPQPEPNSEAEQPQQPATEHFYGVNNLTEPYSGEQKEG